MASVKKEPTVEAAQRPIKKVRRRCGPLEAHQVFDAISFWTSDIMRQQATQERIQTFLKSRYQHDEETVNLMLERCLDDKIILRENKQCVRGKMTGKMIDIHVVAVDVPRDGWDWFCFECHGKGCVFGCNSCHRVYHQDCLPEEFKNDVDNLKCPVCVEVAAELASTNYNREILNKCLGFVCERVKFFVPENVFLRKVISGPLVRSTNPTLVDAEVEPYRENLLLFMPMSIERMVQKTVDKEYKTVIEFVADAKTILHNVAGYHFGNTANATAAVPPLKNMLKAVEHDAVEIKNCMQCFVNSNEQPDNWYCLPCEPPHKLVYAKQKGYCYWPAKVIKKREEGKKVKYDVRFFGAPYERAVIEEAFVKPINTPVTSLSLKRTAKLNSALNELANHIEQMKQPEPKIVVKSEAQHDTASPPKKRMKTAKKQEQSTKTAVAEKVEPPKEEEKTEPELPVEGKTDMPPELDSNRNSVTSSDNCKEESSEDAVSSSNATNGECSSVNNECLEQLRQKHISEIAKIQLAHSEELKKLKEDHRLEIEQINQQHKITIEETKAKIWCCQCFGEAILYCCWQTAYCSKECQHRHWMSDHKLKCRRSR
ncbi:zinc finger MYND domain-containing protein 11-like isoform X2 [Neocloeon triangulifer]|uniref:zinc finger MYND domain-containing protein 11-like isoform X2 n=1 Tax=Neocloeon triangulifer TaxID=2078957 RepID=UPI00286F2309|nr:zinc finger MYND domain-containing protein 11-like isoform X2 [Neocloeon triangulifer]